MLGEISRKSAFWVLDACKGGNVRRHYQDIEKQLNDMAYCKQQVNKNMRKLLHFAVNEVEAYKPYQGYKKLSDFPVIKISLRKIMKPFSLIYVEQEIRSVFILVVPQELRLQLFRIEISGIG